MKCKLVVIFIQFILFLALKLKKMTLNWFSQVNEINLEFLKGFGSSYFLARKVYGPTI